MQLDRASARALGYARRSKADDPNGVGIAAQRYAVTRACEERELESDLISARTKEAMEVKRRQGVVFGHPPQIPREIRERIVRERAAGRCYAHIARDLQAEGVPTVKDGARWSGSTIKSVVRQAQGLPGTARRR